MDPNFDFLTHPSPEERALVSCDSGVVRTVDVDASSSTKHSENITPEVDALCATPPQVLVENRKEAEAAEVLVECEVLVGKTDISGDNDGGADGGVSDKVLPSAIEAVEMAAATTENSEADSVISSSSSHCTPHSCSPVAEANAIPIPRDLGEHEKDPAGAPKDWKPGMPLLLAYVTFNMAGRGTNMDAMSSGCVLPNGHIIVVASQENGPYVGTNAMQKKWARGIAQVCLKNEYKLVRSTHMWATHLMVFARARDVFLYVNYVSCDHVKTGLTKAGGNKGGVAISFALRMLPLAKWEQQHENPLTVAFNNRRLPVSTTTSATGTSPRESSLSSGQRAESSTAANLATDATTAIFHTVSLNPSVEAVRARLSQQVSAVSTPRRSLANPLALPTDELRKHEESGECVGDEQEEVALPPGKDPTYLTFLIINSHLAAHQTKVEKRNRDYRAIVKNLNVGTRGKYKKFHRQHLSRHRCGRSGELDPISSTDGDVLSTAEEGACERDVTEEFDVTLFGGDLNYRVEWKSALFSSSLRLSSSFSSLAAAPTAVESNAVDFLLRHRDEAAPLLLELDQLTLERAKRTVLHGFREAEIKFRPTYKYEINRNRYNFGKKSNKLPAYCDRVLYKRRKNSFVASIVPRLYTDVTSITTSDHRPVVAIFEIETRETSEM